MYRMIADVSNFYDHIVRQLLVDAKIPAHRVRVAFLRIKKGDCLTKECAWPGGGGRRKNSAREGIRECRRRRKEVIVGGHHLRGLAEALLVQSEVVGDADWIHENPETAAKDGVAA